MPYSLRSRLVIIFTVLLVIPLVVIVIVLTDISNDEIGHSIEQSIEQTMDQYAKFVDTFTMQIEDVANQVLGSQNSQKWISSRSAELSAATRVQLDSELRKYLASIALNHSTVTSVGVFHENGTVIGIQDQVYRSTSYTEEDWFVKYRATGRKWSFAHIDRYQPGHLANRSVNSLIYPLVRLEFFGGDDGALIKVNYPTDSLKEPLDDIRFSKSGRLYLVNRDGFPVIDQQLAQDQAFLRDGISKAEQALNRKAGMEVLRAEGVTYRFYYRELMVKDWMLVGIIPESEMFDQLTDIQYLMIWISAGLLALTVGLAYWLSSTITRPLSRLASAMRLMERGDFAGVDKMKPPLYPKGNEVGFVMFVFHKMVDRLQHLIETELHANMRRRDAEYKALLMQINPHFLYNTLEVTSSLALQGRYRDVVRVNESLGRMLRFSLKIDTDIVRLQEEVQYVKYFVSVMEIRFGERLRIRIDEQYRDSLQVIKFILQPLIENAVKYSLEHAEIAEVSLSIRELDDRLEIVVRDNGAGMPQDVVESLSPDLSGQTPHDSLNNDGKRIGLRNVIARCRVYYGSDFALGISASRGKGTVITIMLPVIAG